MNRIWRLFSSPSPVNTVIIRCLAICLFLCVVGCLVGCQKSERTPESVKLPKGISKDAASETKRLLVELGKDRLKKEEARFLSCDVHFITKASCNEACDEAEKAGYQTSGYQSPVDVVWTCNIRRKVVPSAPEFKKFVQFAFELAKRHGGVYWCGEFE